MRVCPLRQARPMRVRSPLQGMSILAVLHVATAEAVLFARVVRET